VDRGQWLFYVTGRVQENKGLEYNRLGKERKIWIRKEGKAKGEEYIKI